LTFDVDLRSTFDQGPTHQELINGHATATDQNMNQNFLAGATGVEVFSPNATIIPGPIGNRALYTVPNDVSVQFTVNTNQPFDVRTNLFMTMGYPAGLADPDQPINPLLLPPEATIGGAFPAGGAGSLIVLLEVLDIGAELVVIPEPSAAILALMSAAGLAAFRRRRSLRA
jgi:MYXO-CTERM domain-containing protein